MNKQPDETPELDPYYVDEDYREQEVKRLKQLEDDDIQALLYDGELEVEIDRDRKAAQLDETRQQDDGPVPIAKIFDELRKKYNLDSKEK